MNWISSIIIILIIVYLLIAAFLLFFMTNNAFFWRSSDYIIPFGLEDGNQERKQLENPRIVYWKCTNPSHNGWVILFHSWARNSARMVSRGQIYWDKGYSILLVDAMSHGQSYFAKYSTALAYAKDTIIIAKREEINDIIVHGLSFGSFASLIFTYKSKLNVIGIVSEATASRLSSLFHDFLRATYMPRLLFGWIPKLILSYDFPWDECSPVNLLPKFNIPVFLIHGEHDKMFLVNDHFELNKVALKNNKKAFFWIVPASKHSKMALHPEYTGKIEEFIKFIKEDRA
jgi:hypothetical protein